MLFLYRTSWGIKLINHIGKKYKKTLKVLSYVSIITGYLLMAGVFYLVYTIVKIYFFSPDIVKAIKVPPILPLFPYIDKVVPNLGLPSFYFTYFIVIIAIIAISHEFAHGIFAANNKVKIKTTGFGFFPFFFPIFLAAFVELNEKVMAKKRKFSQMVILSAGTFANVLTAILFFGVLVIFFSLAFSASGIIFDSYATSSVAVAGISSINGITLNTTSYDKILELADEEGFNELQAGGTSYLATKEILEDQKDNEGKIFVYISAPAIKEGLGSVIMGINGIKIDSVDKLVEELSKYSPGDEIIVKTQTEEGLVEKKIVFEEHPEKPGTAWLGIGFVSRERSSVFGKLITTLSSFKKPNIYYEAKFDGLSLFTYNLLWWLVLISISVALINMLPVGIFDGGRFFYLTIWALTKNEKTAKKLFVFSTKFFLFILFLVMAFWAFSFFR